MIRICLFGLFLATACCGTRDYADITTLVGPCAQEFALLAKGDNLERVRDRVRSMCRAGDDILCPDIWLVYVYCEIRLAEPSASKVGEEAVRRLPNNAAAHLFYGTALGVNSGTGGILRFFRQQWAVREAFEKAIQLDADCHVARAFLVSLYTMPKLLGGDEAKSKSHLAELVKRDTYYSDMVLGQLASMEKAYATAESHYREAHRQRPDKTTPLRKLVRLYAMEGNYADAFDLCATIKPEFAGDGTADGLFIELSMESGFRSEDALSASARFLATARRVAPMERAEVLIKTALILQRLDKKAESRRLLIEAEELWEGASRLYREIQKKHGAKQAITASS